MGIEDYLSAGISFIEWPDKGQGVIAQADIEISIEHAQQKRLISFNCPNTYYQAELQKIKLIK